MIHIPYKIQTLGLSKLHRKVIADYIGKLFIQISQRFTVFKASILREVIFYQCSRYYVVKTELHKEGSVLGVVQFKNDKRTVDSLLIVRGTMRNYQNQSSFYGIDLQDEKTSANLLYNKNTQSANHNFNFDRPK